MDKLNWARQACFTFLLCAATAIALPAQTFTTLHTFGRLQGSSAHAALVQATNGNLYGTTTSGGLQGYGTVFEIAPSGTGAMLYDFCSQGGCSDGRYPYGALVQAADGYLYGTTSEGFNGQNGTVFKIATGGALKTIYTFCLQTGCPDGYLSQAGLAQGIDGNFYGSTLGGGAYGHGTIFQVTRSGALSTLYSFCSQSGCPDGDELLAALTLASDGNSYGTTYAGGINAPFCGNQGCGTVFKFSLVGGLTTLYSFCSQSGCTDGAAPYFAGLVQAADGNFYGVTFAGGANGLGTVFKITATGTLTTLYSFCSQSGCTDGGSPAAGLIQATDGNFYGTTYTGGINDEGTIFQMTPTGTLTTLYRFCAQKNCPDGRVPFAPLVQDTNGTFYGTTSSGGVYSNGTIFSLSVGLSPFVETQRTFGKVGMAVKILGTNLTGATSVTFNGTPATFTVVSPSLITTTVPNGATSGKVQVVTPHGTLSSNVPFRVLP